MSSTRRREPLRPTDTTLVGDDPLDLLRVDEPQAVSEHEHTALPDAPPPPADGPEAVHRPERRDQDDSDRRAFADAVRMLRTGGQSLNLSERTLMVAAGIVAPLGLLCVLLGWYGASRTTNSFEQIPYLISGGLFGLGLVFLGAFFYFAHWMTELVKESRAGSAALLEAMVRLQDQLAESSAPAGATLTDADLEVELVATARGAMAHRADCVVVSGKHDLRLVASGDGLSPCKMCEPYEMAGANHSSV